MIDCVRYSSRGVLRDWNEEYQNCRELPRKTLQDRCALTLCTAAC